MTTENQEQSNNIRRRHGRSPAYPTLPLDKAISQLRALREREGDYAAPLISAFAAWGYSAKSSGGRQTLATLKYYGLIDILGEGDSRKIQISAIGRKILLDDREDQTERQFNLRNAALTPAIHKALFAEYPNGLASDNTVRHFLVFTEGFNETAAREVIAEFRQTAEFSGLYSKIAGDENDQSFGSKFKIGDTLNWESAGQVQWREPWTVEEVRKHQDGKFYYRMIGSGEYEGQEGWIPADQALAVVAKENDKRVAPVDEDNFFAAPRSSSTNSPASLPSFKDNLNMREEKASLDEGEVILRWPDNLSAESVDDLEYWLAGIIRRAKRRAGITSAE